VCAAAASFNLTLRDELVPSDRPLLEQILHACQFFRDDEIAVALELIEDRLAKGGNSEYHFLLAIHNEKLVGYCCYGRIPCTVHSFDLYWIVVDPTLRRGGIGRKLVAGAEERIRALGGGRIYIDTSSRPIYEPTHRFYTSCGYKTVANLHDFYATGDNKIVMLKVFEPPAEAPKEGPKAPGRDSAEEAGKDAAKERAKPK
jgi:GNAT superfamily N-acetyltransferase